MSVAARVADEMGVKLGNEVIFLSNIGKPHANSLGRSATRFGLKTKQATKPLSST